MSIADLGSIANLLAAIGVLVTLIYLARQVRQGNLFARSQVRQRMVEQTHEELYQWLNNPRLRACFVKKDPLSEEEHEIVHYFLLAAMRQREWEWFQFKDRAIGKHVYEAYHGVIALHLGIPRTRRWWQTVGRIGLDGRFVAEVDSFLAGKELTNYYEDIRRYDGESAGPAGPTSQRPVQSLSGTHEGSRT